VGLPTLQDIIEELDKPGRDPREQFEAVQFQEGVNEITDLKVGMKLPGVVTNITKFGAFVDVGVHQDGLVHISHLSNSFVSDPTQVVKLGQKVNVTVLEVDVPRKRISLSMKGDAPQVKRSEKKNQRPSQDKPKHQYNKPKEERIPDGDLQAKLAMLKGKWGN
ncbi:MAG: S1 RNA-binding domain-containing protein, partial [Bacteroidota bacterium]